MALYTGLRRETTLVRVIVALWAAAFFAVAYLTLTHVLTFFFHCPPD